MGSDSLWDRLTEYFSAKRRHSLSDTDPDRPDAGGTRRSIQAESVTFADQVEYGVDERDLPDEDHVLRLLVKRGGRVNETAIQEKTEWSSDRLESVLDAMENDDQISRISVGRKQIVCRRGFEPKGYRSHLHD